MSAQGPATFDILCIIETPGHTEIRCCDAMKGSMGMTMLTAGQVSIKFIGQRSSGDSKIE